MWIANKKVMITVLYNCRMCLHLMAQREKWVRFKRPDILGLHMTKGFDSTKSNNMFFTLFGSLAVMIHTHCELLSYWMGKLGEVKVPDGPCRFDPQVFTATE